MTAAFYAYVLSSESGDEPGGRSRGVRADSSLDGPVVRQGSNDPVLAQLRSALAEDAQVAFDTLFRETYAKLVRFAVQYVATVAAAEDVVGEVFSSLWANRLTLEPRGSVEGYLFGAVRHQAVSAHRRFMRQTVRQAPVLAEGEHWGMGVPAESPDTHIAETNVRTVVWRAIAALPKRQREVLVLRWQAELGWDDVARAVGSTSAAVQMQHSRAIRTLRERLASVLG